MTNSKLPSLLKQALTAIVMVIVAANPAAANEAFFSDNNILYYDPTYTSCVVPAGQTGNIAGSDNAEKVYNYLTTTNFSKLNGPMNAIQASGVLGNFQRESSMDPAAVESNGEGHGLAQWSFGRKQNLFNFASKKNKDWSDLQVQLDFMRDELSGWEGDNLVRKGFKDAATPIEAAEIFEEAYERAGVRAQEQRNQYAMAFYEKYGGNTNGILPISSGNCGAPGRPTGSFKSDSFITWSQCAHGENNGPWGKMKDPWGFTVCNVGCGPTSIAMVIKNMTGADITPTDVVNYYTENDFWNPPRNGKGGGSNPAHMQAAAEHWGLRHETASLNTRNINSYKKHLDAGGLIVANGQGAEPFYTNVRHYVVVRGITDDGQRFIVSDPGRGKSAEWPIEQFMVNTNSNLSTVFYPASLEV